MIRKWVEENNLPASFLSEECFEIDGLRYFLLKDEEGKIFDAEFNLIIPPSYLTYNTDFWVYEFGGNYYYIEKNFEKFEFKILKWIGKSDKETSLHLGVHGCYEILSGTGRYEEWIQKAQFLNCKYLGICEKNTLAGVYHFQKICKEANIKPIIGETISVMIDNILYDFKIYVRTDIGWNNLLKINKIINVDNPNQFISFDEIKKIGGEGLSLILPSNFPINLIPKGQFPNVYYQIDTVIYSNQKTDEEHLTNIKTYLQLFLKGEIELEPIFINDSYYIDQADYKTRKTLLKIAEAGHNKTSKNQYFKTYRESLEIWRELFKDKDMAQDIFEIAYSNSLSLAKNCEFEIKFTKFHLPKYDISSVEIDGVKFESNEQLFWYLIDAGIADLLEIGKINSDQLDIYFERIKREFELIKKGGFLDYFLILSDIIEFCRENKILIGAGRGSIVGSLIAYILDMTKIDPLKYDLLFERFLNEGRLKSLPDVDLDIQGERREEVRNYLDQKYGKEYVCNVGTYQNFKIRSGLKDLGRLLGVNYNDLNKITSNIYIKEGRDGDFEEIFKFAQATSSFKAGQEISSDFKVFIKNHADLVDELYKILLTPKSKSIHPCATIILPQYEGKTIFDFIPIRKEGDQYISEWEGEELDKLGFLKEDILGLHQLDKFNKILELIEQSGKKVDIYNIPVDDEKVMNLFHEGYTSDVFQFGSNALTAYSKEVKPVNLNELAMMVALIRPGPVQSKAHINYVSCRYGRRVAEYDFGLKEVTEDTYGLYIFQEQVMKAVNVLGGFTLEETDEVRRAMGKKKEEVIAPYRNQFIQGAIKNGCLEEEAQKIWNKLVVFSAYGFNKSHAIAYSYMGYISQWFKYYYPIQFWTAALQFSEKEENLARYIAEISRIDEWVKLIPPDINYSGVNFESNSKEGKIFWSLSKIKFLGETGVEEILSERKTKGLFYSFEDFYSRVKLDKRMITNLILSGSFDEIENIKEPKDRKKILDQFCEKRSFPYNDFLLNEKFSENNWYWIMKQRELSGLGFIDYKKLVLNSPFTNLIAYYAESVDINEEAINKGIVLGGIIISVEERKSKNGPWGLVTLNSNNENVQVYFWNPDWIRCKEILMKGKGQILLIWGTVKDWNKKLGIHIKEGSQIVILGESEEDKIELKAKVKEPKVYNIGDVRQFKDGPYELKEGGKWKKVK